MKKYSENESREREREKRRKLELGRRCESLYNVLSAKWDGSTCSSAFTLSQKLVKDGIKLTPFVTRRLAMLKGKEDIKDSN